MQGLRPPSFLATKKKLDAAGEVDGRMDRGDLVGGVVLAARNFESSEGAGGDEVPRSS